MLVLTRAIHESVIVGDEQTPHRVLKVTVLAIAGNHVQLGLELDDNVTAHRWEIWEELRDAAALEAVIDSRSTPGKAPRSSGFSQKYEASTVRYLPPHRNESA